VRFPSALLGVQGLDRFDTNRLEHEYVRIPDDADQRSGMMPITIPF